MNVEIYDQYRDIYFDNIDNRLTEVNTVVGQGIDIDRYSIVHRGVGSTVTIAENLSFEDACNLVTETYIESKTLGSSHDDKLLKLNEGYAELLISFDDGRRLSRVIYLKNVE